MKFNQNFRFNRDRKHSGITRIDKFMVGDGNIADATDIILNFEMYNEMNFVMS